MSLPTVRRCSLAVLAVAFMALPALSVRFQDILHFYSGFDAFKPRAPGGGGGVVATGGEIEFAGPPVVFSVQIGPTDGVLVVGNNPHPVAAVMVAALTDPTHEDLVEVSLELATSGGLSDLRLAVTDDDSGGMIDLEFDDDGTVKVGPYVTDLTTVLPGGTTMPFQVKILLREPLMGAKTWMVSIQGQSGSKTWSGIVAQPGPLSVGSVRITRPALTSGGTWKVDDILVTSPVNVAENQ